MKKISLLLLVFAGFGVGSGLRAQDPQFSQFYTIPMYLNPAFAGAAQVPRVSFLYRNQWPNLQARYNTMAASFDTYVPKAQSGIGFVAMRDVQGYAGITTNEVAAQYAYQFAVKSDIQVRLGLQAAVVQRNAVYAGLSFTSQFDDQGFRGGATGEPQDFGNLLYADLGTGGLLFTPQFYVGAALHHLNRPSQSYLGADESESALPRRLTLQAGYKFALDPATKRGLQRGQNFQEVSFSPALLYMRQGPFDQLNAGFYFTYEPIVVGAWYRGLPIGGYAAGVHNHEAIIGLLGFRSGGITVGYTYDATISPLTLSTGGAHEISITYEFISARDRKRSVIGSGLNGRSLPCPTF
ncbi:MAG: type IX secretion system membrane protein PorP/SprF [Catalinimonas sp.]